MWPVERVAPRLSTKVRAACEPPAPGSSQPMNCRNDRFSIMAATSWLDPGSRRRGESWCSRARGTLPARNTPDHGSGRPAVEFLPKERLVKVITEP